MYRIAAGRSPDTKFVFPSLIDSVNEVIPAFRGFILDGTDCNLEAARLFYGYVEANLAWVAVDIANKLETTAESKANSSDVLAEIARPYLSRLLDWYKELARGKSYKTKRSDLVRGILEKDLKDEIDEKHVETIRAVLLGLFSEDELDIESCCSLLSDYLKYLALALNKILSNPRQALQNNLKQAKVDYVTGKERKLSGSFVLDCQRGMSVCSYPGVDSEAHVEDVLLREGVSSGVLRNVKLSANQNAISQCMANTLTDFLNEYPTLGTKYRQITRLDVDGKAVKMFVSISYTSVFLPSDMSTVYGIDVSELGSDIYTSETPLFTIYTSDKIDADSTKPESIYIEVFHPVFKQIFDNLSFAKLRLGTPYVALTGDLKSAVDNMALAVDLPEDDADFPDNITPNHLLCYAVKSSEQALQLFNHPKTLVKMYGDSKFFSTHQLSYRKIVETALEGERELNDIKADLDKIAVQPIPAAKVKSDKKAEFAALAAKPAPRPGKETIARGKERADLTKKWQKIENDQAARIPATANIQRRFRQAGIPAKVFGLLAYYNDEELRVLTSQVEITSRLTAEQILILAKRDSVVAKQLLKPTWNLGNTFNYLRHASRNLSPAQIREVLDWHPRLIYDNAFSSYAKRDLIHDWLVSGNDVQTQVAGYELIRNRSLARDFFANVPPSFGFDRLAALYAFCKKAKDGSSVIDQIKSVVAARRITGGNISFADKNQEQFFKEIVLVGLSDDQLVDRLMRAYDERASQPDSNYYKNIIPVYWSELLQRQEISSERREAINQKLVEYLTHYKKLSERDELSEEQKQQARDAAGKALSRLIPGSSENNQKFPAHVSMLLKLPEVNEALEQDENEEVRRRLYTYQEPEALFDLAMELKSVRKDLENAANDSAHAAKPLLDAVTSDANKFAKMVLNVLTDIDPKTNPNDISKLRFLSLNPQLFDVFIAHVDLPGLVNNVVTNFASDFARMTELSKILGDWGGRTDEEFNTLKKEHESLKKYFYDTALVVQRLIAIISNPTPALLARLLNSGKFSTENIADLCLAFPKLTNRVYTHEKLVELLESGDITRILALTKAANSSDFAQQMIYVLISYPDIRKKLISGISSKTAEQSQAWVQTMLSQLDQNNSEHRLLVDLLKDGDGEAPAVSVTDICDDLGKFNNTDVLNKEILHYKRMSSARLRVILSSPEELKKLLKQGDVPVIRWLFQRMQSATQDISNDAVSKFVYSIVFADIEPETFSYVASTYLDYIDIVMLRNLLKFSEAKVLVAIQSKIASSPTFALLTQMLLEKFKLLAEAHKDETGSQEITTCMAYFSLAMSLDVGQKARHRDHFRQMPDSDFLEMVRLCNPHDLLCVLKNEKDPVFVEKLMTAMEKLFDTADDGAKASLFKIEVLDNLPLALAACKLNGNGAISKAILEKTLDQLLAHTANDEEAQWFLIKTALLTKVISVDEFYTKRNACGIRSTDDSSVVLDFASIGGDISSLREALVRITVELIRKDNITADSIVKLCQYFPVMWLQAASRVIATQPDVLGKIVSKMLNHNYDGTEQVALDGLGALFGEDLDHNKSFVAAKQAVRDAHHSPRGSIVSIDEADFAVPDSAPGASSVRVMRVSSKQ